MMGERTTMKPLSQFNYYLGKSSKAHHVNIMMIIIVIVENHNKFGC